ncbi:MAG: hypothetical protein AAF797_04330 [Planctomycetota bacterium]
MIATAHPVTTPAHTHTMTRTTLRTLTAAPLIAAASLLLGACGPFHSHSPYVEVGTPLQITVSIPKEDAPGSRAELFYRMSGDGPDYQRQELTPHGKKHHGVLPTKSLGEGEFVQYYIEVHTEEETTALRGKDRPYETVFVSREDLIGRSLSSYAEYETEISEVVFWLNTDQYNATRARVVYSPPHRSGLIVKDLQRAGNRWYTKIKPRHVKPGTWRYRIQTEVEGTLYTVPGPGQWKTFEVKRARK